MRKGLALIAFGLLLAGCATPPKDIGSTYVSPIQYEPYTCEQLIQEGERVSARAASLTGEQQKKATKDAWMTGIGVVLFWPTLFFIKGDGPQAAELSQVKGQMDALQQASIRKQCGIQFQSSAPPPKA